MPKRSAPSMLVPALCAAFLGFLPVLAHAQPSTPYQAGWATWALGLCLVALMLVVLLEALYTFRHYAFTLNRLFARQRPLYAGIEQAHWPHITVFIAAHNAVGCGLPARPADDHAGQ